jgi:tartrate-resistant acid phosphatase type 5
MVGDWGYDDDHTAQSGVTSGMLLYAKQHGLKPQALLMLGENWYRELADGAHSSRWQTQFEEMYRADVFACPAYAIAGSHDYQRWSTPALESGQRTHPMENAFTLVSV